MTECACCGQTLPPRVCDPELKLSPTQQRILDRVVRAGQFGIVSTDLLEYLYADDPNGGPETGLQCLSSHIVHLNKKLAKKGKRVRAPVGGYHCPTAYVYENITDA